MSIWAIQTGLRGLLFAYLAFWWGYKVDLGGTGRERDEVHCANSKIIVKNTMLGKIKKDLNVTTIQLPSVTSRKNPEAKVSMPLSWVIFVFIVVHIHSRTLSRNLVGATCLNLKLFSHPPPALGSVEWRSAGLSSDCKTLFESH